MTAEQKLGLALTTTLLFGLMLIAIGLGVTLPAATLLLGAALFFCALTITLTIFHRRP